MADGILATESRLCMEHYAYGGLVCSETKSRVLGCKKWSYHAFTGSTIRTCPSSHRHRAKCASPDRCQLPNLWGRVRFICPTHLSLPKSISTRSSEVSLSGLFVAQIGANSLRSPTGTLPGCIRARSRATEGLIGHQQLIGETTWIGRADGVGVTGIWSACHPTHRTTRENPLAFG